MKARRWYVVGGIAIVAIAAGVAWGIFGHLPKTVPTAKATTSNLVAAATVHSKPTAPQATTPARAAPKASSPVGYDISYPQCGTAYPATGAFVIVGVNRGRANDTNPCLVDELNWARSHSNQLAGAVVVNTGNPGASSPAWPRSNTYKGIAIPNPYGSCTGMAGNACAYAYGWTMAYEDFNDRGVSLPKTYKWWFDVETVNSWDADLAANRADLEGMAGYFASQSVTVGLYSTPPEWAAIAGTPDASSNLNGLDSWIVGGSDAASAAKACSSAPFTKGGRVALVQYVVGHLDNDYSCL